MTIRPVSGAAYPEACECAPCAYAYRMCVLVGVHMYTHMYIYIWCLSTCRDGCDNLEPVTSGIGIHLRRSVQTWVAHGMDTCDSG